MSIKMKGNLGKRNEWKLSQTLGVEYLDESFKLTKKSLVGNFDIMATTKECASLEITDEPDNLRMGKKKKKYRGSMLGKRTELHNSLLNVNKKLPSNRFHLDEAQENYKQLEKDNVKTTEKKYNPSIELNSENYLESLPPPSPISLNEGKPDRLPTQNAQALKTPPSNPFEYQEPTSNFFETAINDIGPWSVFKTKRDGIKSPSDYLPGKENNDERCAAPKTISPPKELYKKNLKTKLFESSSDDNSQWSARTNERFPCSSGDGSENDVVNGNQRSFYKKNSRKSVFLPSKSVDDAIIQELDSDLASSDSENNVNIKTANGRNVHDSLNVNEYYEHEAENSDEGSFEVDSTIIAVEKKSTSKTPRLSIISEEDTNKNDLIIHRTSRSLFNESLCSFNNRTSCGNDSEMKKDLEQLSDLCFTVQKHSNNVDKLLADLFKEREIYNSHFVSLTKAIDTFKAKYEINETANCIENNMSKNNKNLTIQRKKKPIIAVSPESPNSITKSSTRKNKQFMKSYSELRKSFTYLQTPENKSSGKRLIANSGYYTPKSLSVCISEQLKCLDS